MYLHRNTTTTTLKNYKVDWPSNIKKTKELFYLPDFAIHFVASGEDFLVCQPL